MEVMRMVTIKQGDVVYARRLSGQVDSYGNPTRATILGDWEGDAASNFLNHHFEIEGFDAANRKHSFVMKLTSAVGSNATFSAAVKKAGAQLFGR
jgi:hypothetical protein